MAPDLETELAQPARDKSAPLADRLRQTHETVTKERLANGSTAKGGRPKGYRKINGRFVPPNEIPEAQEAAANDTDVFSPDNFENVLAPFTGHCDEKTLKAGAHLHALVARKHAPKILQDWGDVVMLCAWYTKVILDHPTIKALVHAKIKAPNQSQARREEAAPAAGAEARTETPAVKRPGGDFGIERPLS